MKSNRPTHTYTVLTPSDSPRGYLMLLGYTLLLSPSERGIVEGCLDAEAEGTSFKAGILSTLIARINRKACSISGRGLAEERAEGFGLRPFL